VPLRCPRRRDWLRWPRRGFIRWEDLITTLATEHPLAVTVAEAIHSGDVDLLKRLLDEHPGLVKARLGDDDPDGMSRTLLHVATDWPGNFRNGPEVVRVLVSAGADVNARFVGPHEETPLHWAASSDDVAVLDTLIDLGADIDARGAVAGGGTPLADAGAFRNWAAAYRLIDRGATPTLVDSATLGLMDRLAEAFAADPPPRGTVVSHAFWGACHGGRPEAAKFLLERGAVIDWVPGWEPMTPLDAARRSNADDVVAWLIARGAHSATELTG
jgi:hypothetical protein